MANLTACDHCGKTVPTKQGLFGWWEIKEAGELLIRNDETFPPYTLCCWVCVIAFAAMRANPKEGK